MISRSTFHPRTSTKSPVRSVPSAVRHANATSQRSLLPWHPSSIPIEPRLEISDNGGHLEQEADAIAAHTAGGSRGKGGSSSDSEQAQAPPIVRDALDSPSQALDTGTRSTMEARLGSDLGRVRVHTDARAVEAARAINARAYTVGQDIFFGAGRYDPHSREGKRLLAHELTHTVQQTGGKGGRLTNAPLSVQRDPLPQSSSKQAAQGTTTDNDTKKPKIGQATVTVPPSLLQRYQLTPPSLLVPPQKPSFFSPGSYQLGGGSASPQPPLLGGPGASLIPPPSLYTPPTPIPPPTQPSPYLSPPAKGSAAAPSATPKAPDRLSFHDFGNLSIGARIGFPDLSTDTKPGDPPSALQESLKKGEILNFMMTGQPPSEYAIDPGKLVGALWRIFSTQIAPDVAAKVAAGMASKPTGGGLTYQLDATILFSSSGGKTGGGGGATLTVNF